MVSAPQPHDFHLPLSSPNQRCVSECLDVSACLVRLLSEYYLLCLHRPDGTFFAGMREHIPIGMRAGARVKYAQVCEDVRTQFKRVCVYGCLE